MDVVATMTEAERAKALDATKTAWGATDEMVLFTNDIRPDATTQPGDLQEPVGDWYATPSKVVAYGETYRLGDGRIGFRTSMLQFNWNATGGASASMIYGAGVVSADGLSLRGAARFANPVMMSDVLSSLAVSVIFPAAA